MTRFTFRWRVATALMAVSAAWPAGRLMADEDVPRVVEESKDQHRTSTGEANRTFDPDAARKAEGGHSSWEDPTGFTSDGGGFIDMKRYPWIGIETTAQVWSEDGMKSDQGPGELQVKGTRSVRVKHTAGTCGSTVTIGFLQEVRFTGNLTGTGDNCIKEFYQYCKPQVVMINTKRWELVWEKEKDGATTTHPITVGISGGLGSTPAGPSREVSADITIPLGSSFTTGGGPNSTVNEGAWATKIVRLQCGGEGSATSISLKELRLTLLNGGGLTGSGIYTVDHSSKLKNLIRVYSVIVTPPSKSVPTDPPPPDTGGNTPTVDDDDDFVPPEWQDPGELDRRRASNEPNVAQDLAYGVVMPTTTLIPGTWWTARVAGSSPSEVLRSVEFEVEPAGVLVVPDHVDIPAGALIGTFPIEALQEGDAVLRATYPDGTTETHPVHVQAMDPSMAQFRRVGPAVLHLAAGEPVRLLVERAMAMSSAAPSIPVTLSVEDQGGILGQIPDSLEIPEGRTVGQFEFTPSEGGEARIRMEDSRGDGFETLLIVGPSVSILAPEPVMTVPMGTPVTLSLRLSDAVQAPRGFEVLVANDEVLEVSAAEGTVPAGDHDIQVIVEGLSPGSSVLSVGLEGANTVTFTVNVVAAEEE